MHNDLDYKIIKPDKDLSDFVDSFWFLQNKADNNIETTGLPDGRIDLFLFRSCENSFSIILIGLGTQYTKATIAAGTLMFAISFKLPAVEYIFGESISNIVNNAKELPIGFWGFSENDLQDFDLFVIKATQEIKSRLPNETDSRKQKLFDLIYTTNGNITVKEISEKVFWSSRQINRYFNQQFGISLKQYCKILRFRASLNHLAKGRLYPEENYTDQNHFIKEIKKFSGVVPKELSQNKNDRFVLLSSLPKK